LNFETTLSFRLFGNAQLVAPKNPARNLSLVEIVSLTCYYTPHSDIILVDEKLMLLPNFIPPECAWTMKIRYNVKALRTIFVPSARRS
jgi:hypothetical protein